MGVEVLQGKVDFQSWKWPTFRNYTFCQVLSVFYPLQMLMNTLMCSYEALSCFWVAACFVPSGTWTHSATQPHIHLHTKAPHSYWSDLSLVLLPSTSKTGRLILSLWTNKLGSGFSLQAQVLIRKSFNCFTMTGSSHERLEVPSGWDALHHSGGLWHPPVVTVAQCVTDWPTEDTSLYWTLNINVFLVYKTHGILITFQ